jgi:hypothetical protein
LRYLNWLQCHECGEIVPIYEVEKESSIKNVVETTDNPFEIGTSFLGIDSRTSKGGKNARKKRDKNKLHDDPEISELMRIYGDRVKVVHDSNP